MHSGLVYSTLNKEKITKQKTNQTKADYSLKSRSTKLRHQK